jgi:hypothetical protein
VFFFIFYVPLPHGPLPAAAVQRAGPDLLHDDTAHPTGMTPPPACGLPGTLAKSRSRAGKKAQHDRDIRPFYHPDNGIARNLNVFLGESDEKWCPLRKLLDLCCNLPEKWGSAGHRRNVNPIEKMA